MAEGVAQCANNEYTCYDVVNKYFLYDNNSFNYSKKSLIYYMKKFLKITFRKIHIKFRKTLMFYIWMGTLT